MEGLLSTGPTPSGLSIYGEERGTGPRRLKSIFFLNNLDIAEI